MSYDRDQITDLVHQSQLETIDKCSVCLLTIHEWKKKKERKSFLVFSGHKKRRAELFS